MNYLHKTSIVVLLCALISIPSMLHAQSAEEVLHARVVEVVSERQVQDEIAGDYVVQELKAEIQDTVRKGEIVSLTNDFAVLKKGDPFFVHYSPAMDGMSASYTVIERDRRPVLLGFLILFVVVILFFGKKQGVRSLLSLAGSLFMLAYVLIPSLLKGINPMLASTVIATFILCIAIYFTHGFKKESTVAFLGTVSAVIITGILSVIAVKLAYFTGLGSEDAWYLSIDQKLPLNFKGLLLGGIMIGVLGVLDDIAVTQASVVRELYSSAAHLTKAQIYKKALRVGQEHVGALVNTLALAYTGASLPLLMLISTPSAYPFAVTVSKELFAVEIVRTIVGSIGLVLTVPITTLLAVYMLEHYRGKDYDHDHHGHSHAKHA